MAGGGDAFPSGSAPGRTDNNVSYHYSNQPIWLQYDAEQILSSYFEITARTAFAQFGHFTLKIRVLFQKRRGRPPLGAPLGRPKAVTLSNETCQQQKIASGSYRIT